MKKCLSLIFCFAFLIVGVISFTACGSGKTGEEVYNLIKTQMEIMLEDGAPFANSSSNNVSSKYFLKNFYKKNTNSIKVDYGWHDELIASGLNFVEKHYPLLRECKDSKNVDNLIVSMESMNESFINLKEEYQNTNKISDNEDKTIYNGFIAKYADEARKFSIKVYDFAKEVSKFLATFAFSENQNINLYVDMKILDIYNDYNEFLMVNCEASTGSIPTNILNLQNYEVKTDLSEDIISNIKNYFNALEGERALTKIALNEFSYYEYVVTYNSDISAYEKVLPLASAYLKQINRYYINNFNYVSQAYSYLIQNALK